MSPGSSFVFLKKESKASAEKFSVLAELTKQNTWFILFYLTKFLESSHLLFLNLNNN